MLLLLIFLTIPEFEAYVGNEILIEELQELERNPIQINTAQEKELAKLYWISPELTSSIVKTREKMGGFKDIDDLLKVPGMSSEVLEKIRPYISVVETVRQPPLQFELRTRVQEYFPSNNKVGDPRKAYERVKFGYKNITGVILVEKDYYESDYMDLVTYGLMVQLNERVPNLLIGDYKLEFGEGLIFGYPPVVTFKNQGVIKGREGGIQLYTNSGENTFLRGVCTELKVTNHIKNFVFLSDVRLDGKVEDGEVFIYYDYDGDHSTESGLANKDRIRELLFGTRFEYKRGIKLGVTGYRNSYFLNPEGDKIGTHNLFGVDFSCFFAPIEYFGEIGRCYESYAVIVGAEYKAKKLKLGSLYRYYPAGFFNFHSSPWSDRSSLSETGNYIYAGYKISNNTRLSSYFDGFTRLPNLNSTDLSARGTEYSCEIEQTVLNYVTLTGRYSSERVEESNGKKIRVQSDTRLSNVNLRVRGEKVYEEVQTGIVESFSAELLYGDVSFKLFKGLTLTTRLILFSSNLYKFRLNEYEQDLPGVMTNQFIVGEGSRFYILISDWISSYCRASIKYEITSKVSKPETETTSLTQKYSVQLDLEL